MVSSDIKLSGRSQDILEFILRDKDVTAQLANVDGMYIAKHVQINDDGTVTFSKSPWKVVQWLWREQKVYSFLDISIRLIQILSSRKGVDKGEDAKHAKKIQDNFFVEWYQDCISECNYDKAVRLMLLVYHINFMNFPEFSGAKDRIPKELIVKPQELKMPVNHVLLRDGGGLCVLFKMDTGEFFRVPVGK